MKIFSSLLIALLITTGWLAPARGQTPGTVDATFEISAPVNGAVRSVVPAGSGKVYIAGEFTIVRGAARNRIARLNADGSVDSSFNPGSGANDLVYSVAVQADGKVLLGGSFTAINGTARNYVARLNSDGSLDSSFNPGLGAMGIPAVYSVAVQTDGRILLGGGFATINGTARSNIARLNSDGSLDSSFNPGSGADSAVRSVAVQADGKVLLGGHFILVNFTFRPRVARLNSDGSLDSSFNAGLGGGANPSVYSVAVQTDGRILLGGVFTTIKGTARNNIARLNSDGSLDSSFNPGSGASSRVYSAAVQADGKVLVGGSFLSINGTGRNYVARLNSDGSLDSSFNPGSIANNDAYSVAVQADGKVLLGGSFLSANGTGRNYVARLNSDGTLDSSFKPGSGANQWVYSAAVQADGKILVGGDFTSMNDTTCNRIARLHSDGSLDSSFNPGSGANSTVSSVAVQADGKVLVGGGFTSINGTTCNRIARLNSDGSLDSSFNPGSGAGGAVHSVAVQADGKVLLGGSFISINGTVRNRVARLNSDGSLDSSFNPSSGASGAVDSVAVQADGRVLLGGDFLSINGTTRNYVARLNSDGSLDSSFNPGAGPSAPVSAVAVQADGKVLMGGFFTSVNGTARNRVARLNSNGSLDASFNPGAGANGTVFSVAVQADGKVLLGGDFTTINGTARNRVARLNSDGSLDASFNPGSGTHSDVRSVAVQADGKVLLSGNFTSINGTPAAYLARLNNDAAVQSLSATSPTRMAWLRSGAAPEVEQVTFESSTDGIHWSALGAGTRISGGWERTGLSLPSSGQLRARGRTVGGYYGGSSGIVEQVAAYSLTAPIVTTPTSTLINATSATLGGNVTSDGGAAITERGVVFSRTSLNADPQVGAANVTNVTAAGTTGVFTANVSGLTARTSYSFRAYATNSVGTSYTSVGTFTTPNTAPTAPDGNTTGTTGDAQTLAVSFPTLDADGDAVAITSAASGTGIAVHGFTGTTVTFTPASNYTGPGSFTYTVSDGFGGTATGTITVAVTDNDLPTVTPPANLTVGATTPGGAMVTYPAATANDNVGVTSLTYSKASGTLFANGTTTVTVTARDAANNVATGQFTVTVTPLTAQESWRYQYFGSAEATGNAADDADPDGDGLVNLLELAFGTDPTAGSSGPPALEYVGSLAGGGTLVNRGQPRTRSEAAGSSVNFRMLYVRPANYLALGLSYVVEFSADMSTWQASAATPTVLSSDGTHEVVSVPYPFFIGGKKARFSRVRVFSNP